MSAALHHQAAHMLRAPWQWGGNDGRAWAMKLYAGLATLMVGLPTAALVFWAPVRAVGVLLCIVGAGALLTLWAVQFSALLRLDHPHAARFVMGHGRALRATALGLWLALVGLVGLVATAVLHQPGGDNGQVLMVAVMAAAACFLYVALAQRWWLLWVVVWVPFAWSGHAGVQAAVRPAAAFLQGHWQAQPALWTTVVLLAMAAALVSLFGKADAQHRRVYANRENLRKIAAAGAAGQKPPLAAYGRWGEVLGAPFQLLADAWTAHVTRRASPATASVMTRAEVVLFGAQHWVRHVGAMVLVQGVLALGWYLLTMLGVLNSAPLRGPWAGAQLGLGIGLCSMVAAPLVSLPGALWMSRREQALLVLVPGMPQGAALNRGVARLQLRHFALVWAAGLPAVAACAWFSQSPQAWAFYFTAWPLMAMLWRDVSSLRAPSPWAAVPYVLFVGPAVALTLLLRWQPTLLLPWVLAMVVLTVALLAWRWRKVSQWPQALPAGRLA